MNQVDLNALKAASVKLDPKIAQKLQHTDSEEDFSSYLSDAIDEIRDQQEDKLEKDTAERLKQSSDGKSQFGPSTSDQHKDFLS